LSQTCHGQHFGILAINLGLCLNLVASASTSMPQLWLRSPSIGLRWIFLPRPQARSQGEGLREHGPARSECPSPLLLYLKLFYSSDIVFYAIRPPEVAATDGAGRIYIPFHRQQLVHRVLHREQLNRSRCRLRHILLLPSISVFTF